jgi:hypothetical protein
MSHGSPHSYSSRQNGIFKRIVFPRTILQGRTCGKRGSENRSVIGMGDGSQAVFKGNSSVLTRTLEGSCVPSCAKLWETTIMSTPRHSINQAVAIFLVLMAGCGSHAMRMVDDAAVDTAASVDTRAVEAGPVDATTEIEAGQRSCDDLRQSAQTAFEVLIASYQGGCASDADCTIISSPGRCLSYCSYNALVVSAASAVTDAGKQLCVAFDMQGCQLPELMCPPPPRAVCDAGSCASVFP